MSTITFETAALASALREVRGAVQRRNTIPILSNVLIDAGGNGVVQLTATDMDVIVTRTLQAEVEGDMAVTVDAHRLADLVSTFAGGSQTRIASVDGGVVVSSGRARTRFSTRPAEDFPKVLQSEHACTFTIDAGALLRGLGAVRHAISTEETRYYLNGVYWHVTPAGLAYAATDGHRLARYVDVLPAGADAMPAVIIPTRAIDLIRAIADVRDAPISVAIGDGKVAFTAGNIRLMTKVIDGTFPDYTRVIPTSNDKVAQVDRDALDEVIRRVTVASSDKVRGVKLELEADLIRASVTSPEHGLSADEVACSYTAPPLDIGFNAKFMRDAIGSLDVDVVEITLGDAASPTLITSPKASGVTLVIMPMRL